MKISTKKKRYIYFVAGIVLLLGMILVIKTGIERKLKEKTAITAMYIPFGKDAHVFVDIGDRWNVFEVWIQNADYKVYDINGKEIDFAQLVKGNVVKIYGDGMRLQSWPEQYPGVTEIRVIQEGSPADVDIYQDIIDPIYREPDSAEPVYE